MKFLTTTANTALIFAALLLNGQFFFANAKTCPGTLNNPDPMNTAQGEACEYLQQCIYYAVVPTINCRCNASFGTTGTFVCNALDSNVFVNPPAPAASAPIQAPVLAPAIVPMTEAPVVAPVAAPAPVFAPIVAATDAPTTADPTYAPTTEYPTSAPTDDPTYTPTTLPDPTNAPTTAVVPTFAPTTLANPTVAPTTLVAPTETAPQKDPSCSAYSTCAQLEGNCCPTNEGDFLGCCDGLTSAPSDPLVTTAPTFSPTTSAPSDPSFTPAPTILVETDSASGPGSDPPTDSPSDPPVTAAPIAIPEPDSKSDPTNASNLRDPSLSQIIDSGANANSSIGFHAVGLVATAILWVCLAVL